MTAAASTRRIGAQDSKTRALLLDAAELLMAEEGYAAVTSRRLAARAGLKPQLVHYYFRTMDDLFVAAFRRRAEENLVRFEGAIAGDGSLTNIWRLNADPRRTMFSIEYVALANHRKALRVEIARYAERFRAAQLEAMRDALARSGVPEEQMPAEAALLLAVGLSQVLALEAGLGVTSGHESTVAYIERMVGLMDQPGTRPRGKGKGRSV